MVEMRANLQPRISTAQTPMPRPLSSMRGYPDPVTYVLNPHTLALQICVC